MKAKKPCRAEKQDEKQRKARKPRKEGHSKDHEKKRRGGGKRHKKRMRHLRRVLGEFGKEAGIGDPAALIHVLPMRAWHNMPCRSHVACLQIRPGEMRRCGFKRPLWDEFDNKVPRDEGPGRGCCCPSVTRHPA